MLDPSEVLKSADHIVATTHRFAAAPSEDPAIRATVEATCLAVNAYVAAAVSGAIDLIALSAASDLGGTAVAEAFNARLAELNRLLGVE